MFERTAKLEKVCRRHAGAPLFARLAERLLRKGHLVRAQVLCEEGCERFPDYPTGHVILGRVYATQGLWEEARAAFDQGLRLDPEQPAAYRRLSGVFRELGNSTLALKCLESAARLDPLSASVSRQLEELAATTRTLAHSTSQDVGLADAETEIPPPGAATTVEVKTEPEAASDPVAPLAIGPAIPEPVASAKAELAAAPEPVTSTDIKSEVAPEPVASPNVEAAATPEPFASVQALPEWQTSTGVPDGEADGEADGPQTDAELEFLSGPAQALDLPEPAAPMPKPDVAAVPDIPAVVEQTPEFVTPDAEPADKAAPIDSSEVAALGEGLFGEDDVDFAPELAAEAHVTPAAPVTASRALDQDQDLDLGLEPLVEALSPEDAEPEPNPGLGTAPTQGEPPKTASSTEDIAIRTDQGLRKLVAEIQGPTDAEKNSATEENSLPFATITLARLYVHQGFSDQAAIIYRRILDEDPTHAEARSSLHSLQHDRLN